MTEESVRGAVDMTSKDGTSSLVVVDRMASGELRRSADLLARSFVDERMLSYLLGQLGPEARAKALVPMFRLMLRTFAPFGEIHTARLDGRLAGVGIRVPPGAYPLRGVRQARFTLRMVPGVLRLIARAPRARGFLKVVSEFERLHPKEPHWYLMWVGVDPVLQQRGIGACLAEEAIGLADRQGMPCYLETFGEHTAHLYSKRGFVVRDEMQPVSGGPSGWTMWRPAQG